MLCKGEMMGILCSPVPAQAGYRAVLQAAVGAAWGYSWSLTHGIPPEGHPSPSTMLPGVIPKSSLSPSHFPFPFPLPLQLHGTQFAVPQSWQLNGTV